MIMTMTPAPIDFRRPSCSPKIAVKIEPKKHPTVISSKPLDLGRRTSEANLHRWQQ